MSHFVGDILTYCMPSYKTNQCTYFIVTKCPKGHLSIKNASEVAFKKKKEERNSTHSNVKFYKSIISSDKTRTNMRNYILLALLVSLVH